MVARSAPASPKRPGRLGETSRLVAHDLRIAVFLADQIGRDERAVVRDADGVARERAAVGFLDLDFLVAHVPPGHIARIPEAGGLAGRFELLLLECRDRE